MINTTLYLRGMKGSLRLLAVLAAVITMYVTIIISMYDPELMATLDGFVELMPELMAAVGMDSGANNLLEFMISYLYGFILLIFPMVFAILRGNGLVAKYVDEGSMAALIAAPVRRTTVALTQAAVLVSGTVILLGYATAVELVSVAAMFPGEVAAADLLRVNGALFCLQFFIGGICLLASCLFSDTRYSIGFGAGIPALAYVINMLANVGGDAEVAKYFTFFTLFDPSGIAAGESAAWAGAAVLLAAGAVLYALAVGIFARKDLSI